MHRPIDVFIIGAPKAGTDALRNWLNECPDIWTYGPVEPNYLCDDVLGTKKNKNTYAKRVVRQARGKRLVGEKSTWYLGSQAAITEIATRFPKARIVILMRDNIDLFFSLHAELVKLGVETELDPKIAWQETIADPRRLDFVNTFLPNYRLSCRIGWQIERWIVRFGHERVLIARIRDLESGEGRRRMAAFLGLRQFPDAPTPVANKRLSGGDATARQPAVATGTAGRLARLAKSTTRSLARGVGADRTRPPPPMAKKVALPVTDPEFRAMLAQFFAEDACLAEDLERENRNRHDRHGHRLDV